MPTYEYRCPKGHEFENFVQKMSDAQSELPCPECGVVAPRHLSAGGGLLFKGSGFYITDYGKDGKKDQRAAREKAGASGATASHSPSSSSSSGGTASSASNGSAKPATGANAPASSVKPAASTSDKPKSGPAK